MGKRSRGRPPLCKGQKTTSLELRVPNAEYDAACAIARRLGICLSAAYRHLQEEKSLDLLDAQSDLFSKLDAAFDKCQRILAARIGERAARSVLIRYLADRLVQNLKLTLAEEGEAARPRVERLLKRLSEGVETAISNKGDKGE